MLARVYKFTVVFIVVAIALYLVLMNRETITFALSPSVKISGNAGAVFLSVFALGVIFTGLVGLWFGLKSYLRERKLIHRDKERKEFYDQMVEARALMAAGDTRAAIQMWHDAIKRDPTDIIAKLALADCLTQQGEYREALRVLEDARASDAENLELLFKAAELNTKLGNRTAAIDNLALVLANKSSRKAARLACELSEELGRFDDALEYEARLSSMGPNDDSSTSTRARIEYKKILADNTTTPSSMPALLKTFIKRNPDFAPALELMAEHERRLGNTEEAVQFYIRAARASKSAKTWAKAARIWIERRAPDRALSSLKSAARELTGRARIEAELELIRLYLTLNMLEDARRVISSVPEIAVGESVKLDSALQLELDTLRAVVSQRSSNFNETLSILHRLSMLEVGSADSQNTDQILSGPAAQPSPTLSTP